MSSKSQQDALRELDILALNQEVSADATGVASPNIDSLLQDMSNKARAKRYEEVGSIYDIPHEIENIRYLDPARPEYSEMMTEFVENFAYPSATIGTKIVKSIIPEKSIFKFLEKNLKRLPKKVKDYLTDTTPSQTTKDLIDFGKKEAIKDLGSKEGFERFIYTNLEATGQSFVPGFYDDYIKSLSSSEKKSLYEAYKGFVSSRVMGAEPQKISKLGEMTEGVLGQASSSNAPGKSFIRLNEGKYNENVSDFWKNRGKVTAQHEGTHKATLIDDPGIEAIELMLEQKGFPMKPSPGSDSPMAVSYLKDNLFQPRSNKKFITTKSGKSLELKDNWETNYFEKISEPGILKKGVEATPPQVGVYHEWNDDYDKYALQPLEIVARIAPIRRLRSLANPTKTEKKLLNKLEKNELGYFTKEGLDYAVDKLWMAAPIAPILNLEEELAE